jgi:hypothetical protein
MKWKQISWQCAPNKRGECVVSRYLREIKYCTRRNLARQIKDSSNLNKENP